MLSLLIFRKGAIPRKHGYFLETRCFVSQIHVRRAIDLPCIEQDEKGKRKRTKRNSLPNTRCTIKVHPSTGQPRVDLKFHIANRLFSPIVSRTLQFAIKLLVAYSFCLWCRHYRYVRA